MKKPEYCYLKTGKKNRIDKQIIDKEVYNLRGLTLKSCERNPMQNR